MGKLLQFPQPLARQTDVAVNAEGSQGRRQRSQPTPAVTLFTAYLRREKAASESSISNYLLDLEQFQSWLYVADKTFEQAGRRDVQEWLAAKMAEGLTARSAARKLSTLRAFYRQLAGRRTNRHQSHLPIPKVGKALPHFLELSQLEKMVQWTENRRTLSL